MSFLTFMKRLLSFGAAARPPPTEDFQSVILSHVSMQGRTVLAEIGRHTFSQLDEEMRRYGLVEAAQILVNRGMITATRNSVAIDPVNSDWTEVIVAQRAERV